MTSLSARDRQLIWHPFTQEKTAALPLAIKRASGAYVYDESDRAYLDLISSWWVNLHGHANPAIAKAIYEQASTLEHVIFAGFTHEPAVKLCELLKTQLPPELARFFFSDNGSTSVEVALKMAYQYWFNQGEHARTLFLSFEGAYHGDTFGAMSVGRAQGFHDAFDNLLFDVVTIPFPASWDDDADVDQKETEALAALDQHLIQYGGCIAALIVEPLVQGASGMRMCRPSFLNTLIERVRSHGILVIFDEVMTGFGRTGKIFALEHLSVTPDFICLSKGITGGFLPLALTITTQNIYDAFLSDQFNNAFIHGHSYTGNPLACAAAVASWYLLMDPKTQDAMNDIARAHRDGLRQLRIMCPMIDRIRTMGTIAAFDVKSGHDATINHFLKAAFLDKGLLLRPLGRTVYLLPPYVVTYEEMMEAYAMITTVLMKLP